MEGSANSVLYVVMICAEGIEVYLFTVESVYAGFLCLSDVLVFTTTEVDVSSR